MSSLSLRSEGLMLRNESLIPRGLSLKESLIPRPFSEGEKRGIDVFAIAQERVKSNY